MTLLLEDSATSLDVRTDWIIEGMLPTGHKGMIAACEGACKTTLLAWIAVSVASGNRLFGMDVRQGPVLMIDEETPRHSLENKIYRFCLGLGLEGRHKLPELCLMSMWGFRFARKNTDIIEIIGEMQPSLITIDTLLACLPGGRQGMGENNAETGINIRDNLNHILSVSPNTSILIATHSAKPVMYYDIDDYREAEMQALVRGHGSIVGEACDTGYGLLKITEHPKPMRFALIPKTRRQAIDIAEMYVEMKEREYGEGWARLERIKPVPTPPSRAAIDIFSIFFKGDDNDDGEITAQQIKYRASGLYSPQEIRLALDQLIRNKVIITTEDHFTFKLNPKERKEVNPEYLDGLLDGLSKKTQAHTL